MRSLVLLAGLLLGCSHAFAQQVTVANSKYNVSWVSPSQVAGSTTYSTVATNATTQAVGMFATVPTTISNLNIKLAVAPASLQQDVFTVYVGPAGSMVSTSVTCTVAAATTTCSDLTDSVVVPAGQVWAIQGVIGATNATGISIIGVLASN